MKNIRYIFITGLASLCLGIGLIKEYNAVRDIQRLDPAATNFLEFGLLFNELGFFHTYENSLYQRDSRGNMQIAPYGLELNNQGYKILDMEGNILFEHNDYTNPFPIGR